MKGRNLLYGRSIARRALTTIATLLAVSILIFALTQALPGDLATQILGREATPQQIELLRARLGLGQPAYRQYLLWLGGILQGNLGYSEISHQPVVDAIGSRLRNSLLIAVPAAVIAIPLGIGVGIVSALKRKGLVDHVLSGLMLVIFALPEFVVGSALVLLLALQFPLFPAVTTAPETAPVSDLLPSLPLPTLTLVLVVMPYVALIMRSSLIDSLRGESVLYANLRGVDPRRVVLRHALPGALQPTIHAAALSVGSLLGAIVVVEAVFNYPGMGALMLSSVTNHDVPTVQALTLLSAAVWIVLNFGADLIGNSVNPQLKTSR